MGLLFLFATISIGISFLCSILEAVLLSVPQTYISVKKGEGRPFAVALEHMKKNIDEPLIAILTLNTIAHTVGSILVGVQAEKLFGTGNNAVLVVSAVMTLLILVLSEIIPKTIGAKYWKFLVQVSTRILQGMIFILKWTGIIWLLTLITKAIGGKQSHDAILSREELTAMTHIAEEEGVVDAEESNVIRNLLKFQEIKAKDIMTPRSVMMVKDALTTIENFFGTNSKMRFSRIPIYEGSSDNIVGFVLKDQVLEEMILGGGEKKVNDLKRQILVRDRSTPLPELFETLITEKEHIALIVDEYGSVSGLVTMEDIIETLLGLEIMDESDHVEDLQLLARRNWEERAIRLGIIKPGEL